MFERGCESREVLLVNEFGVNLGFYLLLPFLAAYLTDSGGLPLASVGLVLGVRNPAQQEMFLAGGSVPASSGAGP
ncbi:hypothetical protein ACIG56_14255 [Nocardia fusca]|uniref:hypothetical protein n=1 Tax=Nocardia fusca TaxID=941183 RepID=UPI0037CA5DA1